MSIYIINDQLRFDEKNGSLGLVDSTETEIALPSPASRLLLVLVTNNDKIMTKEEILTEVWERHGWVASNSNLYHYISIVRKSLSKLGENNIIITIPKVGFRFSAESVIEEKKENYIQSDYIVHNANDEIVETIMNNKVEKKNISISPTPSNRFSLKTILLGLILLCGILVALYLVYVSREDNKTTLLLNVAQCEVHNLSTPNNKTIEIIKKNIKDKIKKGLLDCSKKSVVYLSDSYNYKLTYYCPISSYKKTNPESCFNDIYDSEASL